MKYVVYTKDSYGLEFVEFETDSYSKAYHYCKRRNEGTSRYLEECQELWEQPGNTLYYWFEKKGIKKQ